MSLPLPPGKTEEQRTQDSIEMKEKKRQQAEQEEMNEDWSDAHSDFPKDDTGQQETNFGVTSEKQNEQGLAPPDVPDERDDVIVRKFRRLTGKDLPNERGQKEIMDKRLNFKKWFGLGIRPEDNEELFKNATFELNKSRTGIAYLKFDEEQIFKLRKDGRKELYSEVIKDQDGSNPVKVARMKFDNMLKSKAKLSDQWKV